MRAAWCSLMWMKTCKKCGSTDHYADGHCRPCALARLNAKRRENPTLANEKVADWRKRNPDKVKAYSREYRAANLDKIIAYQRAYNEENREANKMRRNKWRANEKARLTEAGVLPKVRVSVVMLGKPCKVCGSTEFYIRSDGRHRECKACAKARQQAYHAANRDAIAARQAVWLTANKEKMLAYREQYYADHAEEAKASVKAWKAAYPDKVKANTKRYYEKHSAELAVRRKVYNEQHPDKRKEACARSAKKHKARIKAYLLQNAEKVRAYKRKWKQANPVAVRLDRQNRMAKERENGGKLSKDIITKLYRSQQGRCACCGKPIGDDYHLDHIIPVAKGGQNIDSNVQLLTAACNMRKSDRDPIEYMQSQGFLL